MRVYPSCTYAILTIAFSPARNLSDGATGTRKRKPQHGPEPHEASTSKLPGAVDADDTVVNSTSKANEAQGLEPSGLGSTTKSSKSRKEKTTANASELPRTSQYSLRVRTTPRKRDS